MRVTELGLFFCVSLSVVKAAVERNPSTSPLSVSSSY